MNKHILITHSEAGERLARRIRSAGFEADLFVSGRQRDYAGWMKHYESLIFIGSLGICVRSIAPHLKNKKSDPAVINLDVNGQFVQPVVSGHLGGANDLARELSHLLGAIPVLTTVSDSCNLWALDLLPRRFGWQLEHTPKLTQFMSRFINHKPTALLLEVRDEGTLFLENSLPEHVSVFYRAEAIDLKQFDLILAVTPFLHPFGDNALFYRPPVVVLGLGSQKDIPAEAFSTAVIRLLEEKQISPLSVAVVGTAELKKDEPALYHLAGKLGLSLQFLEPDTLKHYAVPNPSEKVKQVAGTAGVAEAAAMHLSGNRLLLEKTKLKIGEHFATVAAAILSSHERNGFVEIVGAGPGDPLLVTVRGKLLLEAADLILYAGSLVPKELTGSAKSGCVVRSSAAMDLSQQISLMKEFYDRGLLVVRLHTGDPCIYGAIQEQMNRMDREGMDYRITPGVSSFQAAAAALKSQFTIPEEVQTIILTRGEGRTPMPEREQLQELARSQSTICIYLSASIAGKVQQELLVHYPADTPVAVCYKLTWKEEKIFRCPLSELAETVERNQLSMTTLIVVGKAIGNRSGESRLYHPDFKHTFRS